MTKTQATKRRQGVGGFADAVVLNRLRGGLDRRVEKALNSPQAQQLIADEVARQLKERAVGLVQREFTLGVLLGAKVRVKRWFSAGQYNRLAREIKAVTGATAVDMLITQAFRSLLDAESRGLGRIAGGPCNILGKLVVPMLIDLPDGPVLEIGTLYGLFTPTLLRSLRRTGQFRDLTVVDPFTGRQMQGGENMNVDPSQTPAIEEVAVWNFGELGVDPDGLRVINGFSTDAAVQVEAGDRKYALVVVDGDHFEDGVASDLKWVEQILAPGGIAILDDYGDPNWPGVEAATTKYLADDDAKMTMFGTVWTSCFLQMPTDPQDE